MFTVCGCSEFQDTVIRLLGKQQRRRMAGYAERVRLFLCLNLRSSVSHIMIVVQAQALIASFMANNAVDRAGGEYLQLALHARDNVLLAAIGTAYVFVVDCLLIVDCVMQRSTRRARAATSLWTRWPDWRYDGPERCACLFVRVCVCV